MKYISPGPLVVKKIQVPQSTHINFEIGELKILYRKDFQFFGFFGRAIPGGENFSYGLSGQHTQCWLFQEQPNCRGGKSFP